jgi:hypothetical protein
MRLLARFARPARAALGPGHPGIAAFFILLLVVSAFAEERRPGVIKLTNGQEVQGDIWFSGGKLRIYEGQDASGGRYLNVAQDELVSLAFSVQEQSMERPWRYKNAGSDEKQYFPGEYPRINLHCTAKLKSGKPLEGHLMPLPVFVRVPVKGEPGDYDDKKFQLKYQLQGEAGQTYKDLVYVSSIIFSDAGEPVSAENCVISGTVANAGKLEQVAALGVKRMQSYQAKVNAEAGTYQLIDLPKDTYDLAILTDRGIFLGLSNVTIDIGEKARPLEESDGRAIAAAVAKLREFFDVRDVLAVKGHRDGAKVLVHLLRDAPVYDQQTYGDKKLQRLEVWYWHLRESEWISDEKGRVLLFRYEDENKGFRRSVQLIEELGGLVLDSAVKKSVEVNYEKK